MGAESFVAVVSRMSAPDFPEAFLSAVHEAHYWHGHAGYTGTICEKPSYEYFHLDPAPSLFDAENITQALDMSWGDKIDNLVVEWFGDKASEVSDLCNDKWGNAVAFRLDNGDFFFCGIASC